jgi:nitrous oxidase accessory protein
MLKKCVCLMLLVSGQDAYSQELDYCENGSYGNQFLWIDALMSGEFFNSTGPYHNNYGDQDHLYIGYDDQSHQVIQWQTGPNELVLVPGRLDQPWMDAYPSHWQVWIDFNQDLIFAHDERVLALSGLSMLVETVDLSDLVVDGELTTRMRVSSGLFENAPSCGSIDLGEVEDYTVSIDATVLHVPDIYGSIQEAIDAAQAGDKIVVHDGVYAESLLIDKPLTLTSVNGPGNTNITGVPTEPTIVVMAPDVTIQGFDLSGERQVDLAGIHFTPGADRGLIKNVDCGVEISAETDYNNIHIDHADDVKIDQLHCVNRGARGVYADRSSGIHITNSTLNGHIKNGISFILVDDGLIENNVLNNNLSAGLSLKASNGNVITNNLCDDNRFGMSIGDSVDLLITKNRCNRSSSFGLYITQVEHSLFQDNLIADSGDQGVLLKESNLVTFQGNTVKGGFDFGLHVLDSFDLEINENTFETNREYALMVERMDQSLVSDNLWINNFGMIKYSFAFGNVFTGNSSANDIVGGASRCRINATRSSNNMFYLNEFNWTKGGKICLSSSDQSSWTSVDSFTYEFGGQTWTGQLGNYYHNADHFDVDGDGVAELAHPVHVGPTVDTRPLAQLLSFYLLQQP